MTRRNDAHPKEKKNEGSTLYLSPAHLFLPLLLFLRQKVLPVQPRLLGVGGQLVFLAQSLKSHLLLPAKVHLDEGRNHTRPTPAHGGYGHRFGAF